jgi:hypothetical protein
MSKRLQVILKDPEYREYQRMARARRMTMAEWVRQALDEARRRQPVGDVAKKLAAVRAAAAYQGPPSPDIEVMLAEIESGYLSDKSFEDRS